MKYSQDLLALLRRLNLQSIQAHGNEEQETKIDSTFEQVALALQEIGQGALVEIFCEQECLHNIALIDALPHEINAHYKEMNKFYI